MNLSFFYGLFMLSTLSYGQQLNDLYVPNDSVKYNVFLSASSMKNNNLTPLKSLIILSLDSSQILKYQKLEYQGWVSLLESEHYDWSTNLVLYCIFEKDAYLLTNKTRDIWIKHKREKDLSFWKEYLPNNLSKANFYNLLGN